MKQLIIGFLLVISVSSFANCRVDLDGLDYSSDERDVLTEVGGINVSESMLYTINIELEFECTRDQISAVSYRALSGVLYHYVLTNDDNCDGGNSYGFVYDAHLNRVAVVQDGFTSCL